MTVTRDAVAAIPWCSEPCANRPDPLPRWYGTSPAEHVHHVCWCCGTEVVSRGTSYICGPCDVSAGPDFTQHTPQEYDADFAANSSSPA